MIITIAKAILALIKAFPKFLELFEMVYMFYIDWKISQLQDDLDEKAAQRKSLLSAIQKAKTNEERLHLSKLMYDLIHSK